MTASKSAKQAQHWVGFGLLFALFAVDFHFDVRHRDLFSWMDPYQYFDFALGVVEGREQFDQFEVPSIFPFFMMPLLAIAPSIPAALWINGVSMLLMLLAVRLLCRELDLETPAAMVALLVLSSPLLVGLSRTLYVEFTLSALMALVFFFWLRFLKRADLPSGLAFGAAFALAFMTKLTSPVSMVLPVAGASLASLAAGDFNRAGRFVYAAAVPVAVGIAIHVNVFAHSLAYTLSLANTSLPIMYLIGPTQWPSWSAATYYVWEIGETVLFLLVPFLGLNLWLSWPRVRATRLRDLGSPRSALWLWLLSLVLVFAHNPVEEPRHLAPGVVPAVLLVVLGIESLSKPGARTAARALAVALACVQYAAVTGGGVETPYFMDRSLHYEEIRDQLAIVDARPMYAETPETLRSLHWNYNQNVAIAGFSANEALALTWQGFPGVVFDLDVFDRPTRDFEQAAYERFEDLFFLAAVNSYNRRCGWHRYQQTLSRKAVVRNADILILNDDGSGEILKGFAHHERFASIERGGGVIHLLRTSRKTEPYRALYARNFLERNRNLEDREVHVIAREMLMAAALDRDPVRERSIQREFRGVATAETLPRNIYWIGGYPALLQLAAQHSEGQPR